MRRFSKPEATAYRLVSTPGGATIHSVNDGETFHPVAGPQTEAAILYSQQLRLAEWSNSITGREFVIWDVGLGGAGNVCSILRSLEGVRTPLRIVSFDHSLAPLQFALENAHELSYLRGFDAILRALMSEGEVALESVGMRGRWQLCLGDFPELVCNSHVELPSPEAVLFDAFSPARNPAMWSVPVFRAIRTRVRVPFRAELATFSRATLVRTALLLAGWFVGRGEAIAGKEETTVASTERGRLTSPLGAEFLRRAQLSNAAEPLTGREYRRLALTSGTAVLLREHPQFAGCAKTI